MNLSSFLPNKTDMYQNKTKKSVVLKWQKYTEVVYFLKQCCSKPVHQVQVPNHFSFRSYVSLSPSFKKLPCFLRVYKNGKMKQKRLRHSSPAGRFSSIRLMNFMRISVTPSPLRVSWANFTSTAIWTWRTPKISEWQQHVLSPHTSVLLLDVCLTLKYHRIQMFSFSWATV